MRIFFGICSFLIFISTAVFLSFCNKPSEKKEIHIESTQPFLNLGSEAYYTGTKSCISCHSEIHDEYMHTGKGKAFHPVDKNKIVENFDDVHVFDAFSGYHYTTYWRSDKMYILEFRLNGIDTTYKREVEADFVIGSGNQTRTYIFEENGYFYEMPITWYVKKGIWDLSPGYENGANTRFTRPISEMCMNCHNSDFTFSEFSVNKFLSVGDGIGCEKCHGPGSLHIAKMNEGKYDKEDEIDYSIVNPAHLSLELQFDVCRQCHLEGVTVAKQGKDFMDYRPGMALSDFWEVFIPVGSDANDFGFASHVERLQMSKCFIASDGKMNCTTCHDAHKPLAQNALSIYNQKCTSCHGIDACGAEHQLMAEAENNCVKCHMPKDGTTDIPHVSSSDHFIRIVKESEKEKSRERGLKEFRNFTSEESSARDIFMANLDFYEKVEPNTSYLDRIEKFISEVERDQQIKFYYLKKKNLPNEIVIGDPQNETNPYTSFYIGEILERQGKNGLAFLERAVVLAPDNLEMMTRLGNAYLDKQKIGEAKLVYGKILEKSSLEIMPMVNLGFIFQMEGNFTKALELTEKALKIDPLYLKARENRINIYLNLGDMEMAVLYLRELINDYPSKKEYRDLLKRIETSNGRI